MLRNNNFIKCFEHLIMHEKNIIKRKTVLIKKNNKKKRVINFWSNCPALGQ